MAIIIMAFTLERVLLFFDPQFNVFIRMRDYAHRWMNASELGQLTEEEERRFNEKADKYSLKYGFDFRA